MSSPSLDSLPRPEPTMGVAAYNEERRLRLATDARCNENYQKYLRAQREPNIDYLPIKLDVENVSRCNFRCTMCQVSDWPKGKRADDMSLDEFKQLLDEQYGVVEIKVQGMGEPTMGAPDVFHMISHVRQKHIWVRTITNASLLHLKDNYKQMIDSDPNEIQVSIDGATKEVFESIRRGSVFEQVQKNCVLLNNYGREQKRIRTKMWTVVQKNNVHELSDLVSFAADAGFESMVLSLDVGDWGSSKWHDRNNEVMAHQQLTYDSAMAMVEKGKKLGVTVAFWNIAAKYSPETKASLCPWPFERAYVSSDMRVVPCCMIANPATFELGDAHKFTEVWNAEKYQTFRQDHIDGKIPSVCQNCYVSKNS